LDQRTGAAVDHAAAARGREDMGEQLEDGGLARAVRTDDAERLARLHGERHVAHRPELPLGELVLSGDASHHPPRHSRDQGAQAVVQLAALELLPDALELDARIRREWRHQTYSANTASARWKMIALTTSPVTAHAALYARYHGLQTGNDT